MKYLLSFILVILSISEQTNNDNITVHETTITRDELLLSSIEVIPCSMNTFKSYMHYDKVTAENTPQFELKLISSTNEFTGIREYDGYLEVAMAKSYGPVGKKYSITFSSGQSINVIIAEIKDNTECAHPDGSMIEFVVDVDEIPQYIKTTGNFDNMFKGVISKMIRLN